MSSFVRFEPVKRTLEATNPSIFDDMIRIAFSQRRKKISNSLKAFHIDWDAHTVDATSRADQLGVSDYVELANSCLVNAARDRVGLAHGNLRNRGYSRLFS